MREIAGVVAAAALALLWALQSLSIFFAAAPLVHASMLGLMGLMVPGLMVARPAVRLVCLVALGLAAMLGWQHGSSAPLMQGARSAVLFAAFLATMQMLKVALETSSRAERLRDAHESLPMGQQRDAIMLRAWLLGAILAAGAVALLAPLVRAQRPLAERTRLAQSVLQGMGLALLWSPFFVAMAVCTRLSPKVTLPEAVLTGLAMATVGLVLSHASFGATLQRQWVQPLGRVAAAAAAMACALLGAHAVWGISSSEAIVAGVPWIAAWMAFGGLRRSPVTLARRWLESLRSIAPEATLVSASLILGEVIRDLLARGVLPLPSAFDTWPDAALIAWPGIAMALLSRAGFHPIIGASLLFPLQGTVAGLHPAVGAASVMVGWMLAVQVSTFAVPVMFASTVFKVPAQELVRGDMWRFALRFALAVWTLLWILNTVLRLPGTQP